jgi:hypothetical protein
MAERRRHPPTSLPRVHLADQDERARLMLGTAIARQAARFVKTGMNWEGAVVVATNRVLEQLERGDPSVVWED